MPGCSPTLHLERRISRFLFIDCDVYVRAPIEQLIDIDLNGHSIAAAPEPGRQHLVLGDDMAGSGKPFASWDPYFNAGVMVIDRAKWAAADLPGTLDGHIKSGLINALYQDQDILNLRSLRRLAAALIRCGTSPSCTPSCAAGPNDRPLYDGHEALEPARLCGLRFIPQARDDPRSASAVTGVTTLRKQWPFAHRARQMITQA